MAATLREAPNVAILQGVLALITRSLGRILSAIFGWAVVALFGRTTSGEQTLLSGLVAAAAAWPILLLGIAVPKIATWVLAFVPLPAWVPSWVVRIVWLALAVAVPFAVGFTMAARRPSAPPALPPTTGEATRRRASAVERDRRESSVKRVFRGFPITVGIAAAFLVVFVTVPVLRLISAVRRRIDVHVPLITDSVGYGMVAERAAQTLTSHGFSVRRAEAPWWMTAPQRILATLGGPSFRAYVPERLAYFVGPQLAVALYPNGLLLRGSEQDTAWAHGLVVEALSDAPAYQTFDPAAQDIEAQIRSVWAVYHRQPAAHEDSAILLSRLADIARDIRHLPVPYDEWQTIYRQALQLGRALHGERQLLEAVARSGDTRREAQPQEVMMLSPTEPRARALSTRELTNQVLGKAVTLVKTEVELAKLELKADVTAQLARVKGLAIAGVLALFAANILLVAGVLALALLMPGWLAGLLVGGVLLVTAAVIGYVSWRRTVSAPLALTRKTLKENVRWAKERIA
jgi:hypothetical protein